MPLIEPTKQTLAKYGLSLEEWLVMADAQGHVCYICQLEPVKGRLALDHEHVKFWKKLAPEHRKLFVRGLLCFFCNFRILGRGMTLEKAKRVVSYLEQYSLRRPAEVPKPPKKLKKSKKKR